MRHTALIAASVAVLATMAALVLSACQPAAMAPTPTPGPTEVPVRATFALVQGPSYSKDIQPIFDYYCVRCHGAEKSENGLRLDSYQGVMKGTQYGAVVAPGSPEVSTLYYTISQPTSPQVAMPKDAHRLSSNRILNIRYWIEAGAKDN